jgi:Zn-dependent M28 family amino/carboxypeptidase
MKNIHSAILLLIVTGILFFATKCKKDEESDSQRKETLIKKLNDQISADSLKAIVTWMEGFGTRFALSDNHRNIAIQIRNRFKLYGFTDARIDSFMINKTYQNINYQQWQYNVIAAIEGVLHPDSVCIIGGHYDDNLRTGDPFSAAPGANDNASGLSAAIEIARVMKKNGYVPGNTIEFVAFGSEELGLFGSSAYAFNAFQSSKKIKMMLNNDMIAYQPDNYTDWTVNIMDYENSHELRAEAEQIAAKFTDLHCVNDNTYNKQSDSYPFYVNGFEAIFFFSNIVDPNYHTINDKAANCNFNYCREIAMVCCALLVDKN